MVAASLDWDLASAPMTVCDHPRWFAEVVIPSCVRGHSRDELMLSRVSIMPRISCEVVVVFTACVPAFRCFVGQGTFAAVEDLPSVRFEVRV